MFYFGAGVSHISRLSTVGWSRRRGQGPCAVRGVQSLHVLEPFLRPVREPCGDLHEVMCGLQPGVGGCPTPLSTGAAGLSPRLVPEHLTLSRRVRPDHQSPWVPAQVVEDVPGPAFHGSFRVAFSFWWPVEFCQTCTWHCSRVMGLHRAPRCPSLSISFGCFRQLSPVLLLVLHCTEW